MTVESTVLPIAVKPKPWTKAGEYPQLTLKEWLFCIARNLWRRTTRDRIAWVSYIIAVSRDAIKDWGEGLTSSDAIRRICSIIDWDIILKSRAGLELGSQYIALVEEEDELRLGEKFGPVDHFPEYQ